MIRLAIFVIFFIGFIFWYIKHRGEPSPSKEYHSVDVLVPAFNEEACIEFTIKDLLSNRYVKTVICIDDGSTDGTWDVINKLQCQYPDRVLALRQKNKGKAAALNNGLRYVTTPFVFTTDADTRIPDNEGIGYLISHLENGAEAVGGVPASDLSKAGILPKMRASIKASVILIRRGAMEVIGGSPFVISGSCGLYKTETLKKIGIPDRTQVEDLDLTWTLVEMGYKVEQSAKCVVYAQECNSLLAELKRWKRWIVGYAVCIRLHKKLTLSRFGAGVILPGVLIPLFSVILFYILPMVLFYVPHLSYNAWWLPSSKAFGGGPFPWWIILSPWWVIVLIGLSSYSAKIQKKWTLVLYSPLSVFILLIALFTWLIYGIPALITGKEPPRVKPSRYNDNGRGG